jgi:hypothetical protein
MSTLTTSYEKAYATDGLWSPGSFKIAAAGPLAADLNFDDREGGHWSGVLTVEPSSTDEGQFGVRMVIRKQA